MTRSLHDLILARRTSATKFSRLILAVSLVCILQAESSAEGIPSVVGEQANVADSQQESQSPSSVQGVNVEAGVRVVPREWFGGDLPWWEWSTLTGDWGGWRSRLKDAGIAVEGSHVLDWSHVASGGIRKRSTFQNFVDLRLTVDLKPLLALDAGTIWARYYAFFGRNASRDVGDIQGFANIDSDRPRHQLAELWYEQRFINESLRLKVGKVDANTEFAFAENAAEFINSSMGFSPTIFTLPTYPDPAMSVNLFVYPTEKLYAGFGAYDGAGQRGIQTGSRGPATFFKGLNRLFYIGEVGGRWQIEKFKLPGRLGIGGWHHNSSFDRFDDGTKSGSAGFYLALDQTIWRAESSTEDKPQGIGMFFQFGVADGAVSEIKRHLGGGLIWRGPVSGRNDDALGWGLTWVRLSGAVGAGFDKSYELSVESFYKIQITPWFRAKPDLQYIVNPSGARGVKNALVSTLRFELTF